MIRSTNYVSSATLIALAGLLLVLSAFAAAPVTASEVNTTANSTVELNASTVDGGTTVEGETFNVTIDEQINSSDTALIQLSSDEGDIELNDSSINTNNQSNNVSVSSTVINGNVYSTTDDTIELTFEDTYDAGTNPNVELKITFSYDVASRVSGEASGYTNTSILTGTSEGNIDVGGVSAAELSVHPSTPNSLQFDDSPERIAFDDGSDSVTVEAVDEFDNRVNSSSFTGSISEYYDQDLNLTASLINSSDGTVDTADQGTSTAIKLNSSNNDQATFEINSSATDTENLNDLVVGDQLAVNVSETGGNYSAGSIEESLVIEPDTILVSTDATSPVFADDANDGIGVTHELANSSNSVIADGNIDTIDIQFKNVTNDGGLEEANVTSGEVEFSEDDTASEYRASINNGTTNLTLSTTDNSYDNLTLNASVTSGTVANQTAALDILSGEIDQLTFAESTGDEKELELNVTNVTVQAVDAYGNTVDDRDLGSTTIKVTQSGGAEIPDRSTADIQLNLDNDGDRQINLTDTGSGDSNITAAVGTFDYTVAQTAEGEAADLADATVEDITIYPNVTVGSQPPALVNASEEGNFRVALNDSTGEALSEEQVDQVNITTAFQAEALQNGRETVPSISDVTLTQSPIKEVPFSSDTAGKFNVSLDVTDVDDTAVQTNTIEVAAGELSSAKSDISFDRNFAGTVQDDSNTTVTIKLRDQFGNYLGYSVNNSKFNNSSVTLNIAEQDVTNDLLNDANTSGNGTNVEDANSSITYDLDSTTLDNATTGSSVDVKVTDDYPSEEVSVTTSFELVHEAFDLSSGFQRISLPQPASVSEENVDHTTTWNTTDASYDQDKIDIFSGDVSGDAALHNGLYVSGSSNDARIGFNFDTSGEVNVGQESLEAGWNFLGTNYDISTQDSVELEEDLLTVDEIDNTPSSSPVVYDGGLSNVLNASDGGNTTADLTEDTTYASGYGTYWVYVEDPDSLDSATRELIAPRYQPSQRNVV